MIEDIFSILILAIPAAIVLGVIFGTVWKIQNLRARNNLRQTGTPGRARILRASREHFGNGRSYKIEAELLFEGRAPFVHTFSDQVMRVQDAALVPGAIVNVVSDPAMPSRILLDLRERPTDPAMRGIPIPNPRDALEEGRGVPGAARVLQITGGKQRSFDGQGLTYNVSFLLEVDAPRRYLAHIYQVVGERHLPLVQVGASVPIRVDPSQPEHVAIAL